ncbi:aminoglycoside 6'-N-acetyltransferase [Runella slithyformis]|uniref:Aminoglycoside N(6')-acetyltransferase type 1 n=1 Tax=Runella slithyformis (strain ATCC 29530 / DSM 19594 / LMG 11500 / NCIMB 11436 / LSU 4) TaxID=761193 RepID=A0A7U3ZKX5_RUNSL|nr:aminoglycoside 6'-N-acetyltransferase [Runella slithyformis]AEI49114.1 GCN5-related N-acetyltransferase [Runella slithyformis DSM 19594]
MHIELLSADNCQALTELALELWPDAVFEEEYEEFAALIESENDRCCLAREGEEYMGFAHISIRREYVEGADDLPVAYVEGIYVRPRYQKQGIAKQLMAVAEAWARQKGLTQLASDTPADNSASIHFHTNIGFTEAGRIVCFIKEL